MSHVQIVCLRCPRAFPQGDTINAELCDGCPSSDPQPAISEAQWRELEHHIAEREIEATEAFLDAYTPSQQSVERGKISQPRTWRGPNRRKG